MQESEIKALISLLGDEDPEVRTHVHQKIRELGDTVIPYLEQAWEEKFHTGDQKIIEDTIHTLQFEHLKARLLHWKNTGGEDLLEGMWLIATYQYPDLDISHLRSKMDYLYYECWLELRNNMHPADQVTILNHVLFNKFKFGANTKNFHAPGNSLINVVLEGKKGNPISLCVIYMLVAQKLKMPVYGVNLPNIFVLTYKSESYQFYINAFNRGVIFSKAEIDSYLTQCNLQQLPMFYEPCNNLDIIKRVLRNLAASFEKTGDLDKQEEMQELLQLMNDGDTSEELPDDI